MEKLPPITPNRFVISPASSRSDRVGHFTVRRTRDAAEAERRRQQKTGTLVLEQQVKGFEIIKSGLLAASSLAELSQWAAIAVPATIGASQYHMNGQVMHRHVPLPMLASHRPKHRPNVDALHERVLQSYDTALTYAEFLLAAHQFTTRRKYQQLAVRAGRTMAHAALSLYALPLSEITADAANDLSNTTVQEMVRSKSLEAVRHTETVALEIGVVPTAAQLPDPISPLGVEIQRSATDAIDRIYQNTLA